MSYYDPRLAESEWRAVRKIIELLNRWCDNWDLRDREKEHSRGGNFRSTR